MNLERIYTTISYNSTSFDYFDIDKWQKLQENCKNSVRNVRFSVFQSEVRRIFFQVHIDLEKKLLRRTNKAQQSRRTSIVIAIVFLKQRSVCIMK